jgi:uncharacterized repeat protein (TIGR02543 family)
VDNANKEVQMMKKKLATLALLLLITALMLAACGKPGQSVTYTVTFETNGGGGIDAQTVEKDEKVSKPADPAKDGYGFEGWYKDAALEAVWDFTSDTVTKNTTLYAA